VGRAPGGFLKPFTEQRLAEIAYVFDRFCPRFSSFFIDSKTFPRKTTSQKKFGGGLRRL